VLHYKICIQTYKLILEKNKMINKQAFLIGYKQAQQYLYKQAARKDDEEDEGWDWKDYAMAGARGIARGIGLGAAGLGLYNYLRNSDLSSLKEFLS
jgi:hypothetical protein